MRLLTQFTTIPDGMKFLVDLRATLLDRLKGDAYLTALDSDLKALLANWFDIGFLELQRIDWHSPAVLLERLVGYEAVHEIRSWSDLKNRLDSDRRCYALFHPSKPAEPLIFVEVALVRGLAGSVQRLLDKKAPLLDPKEADTAIFYSISNCQRGLAGISFGNYLIKRVVGLLESEYRTLKTFATLSPIPGFRRWLDGKLKAEEAGLVSPEETTALLALAPEPKPANGAAALAALMARRGWAREAGTVKALEPILIRLAARYLLIESRGDKRALDPVAHFHLGNGARIERIMMGADTSDKGVKESATLMVNYVYDPAKIEDYHRSMLAKGSAMRPPLCASCPRGGRSALSLTSGCRPSRGQPRNYPHLSLDPRRHLAARALACRVSEPNHSRQAVARRCKSPLLPDAEPTPFRPLL